MPPCCSTIAFTIDEPEPEAAGVAGAAVVEAGEAVEHPLAVLDRDAGTVVVDGELDGAVAVVVQLDRHHRARAWRSALSSRLRTTRGELLAPPVHPPGRDPGGVDAARGASRTVSSSTSSSRSTSGSDVERRGLPALVEAGEVEQLARPCPPCARPRRARAAATAGQSARSGLRSATSRFVRIDASGLRSSCDASDTNWRWRLRRRLEPVEHRVHRAREAPDLVVGVGLGHAPVDRGAGDRLGLGRIASTGRSARPVKYHAASATSSDQSGHGDQQRRRSTLSTVRFDLGERLLRDERDVAGLRV